MASMPCHTGVRQVSHGVSGPPVVAVTPEDHGEEDSRVIDRIAVCVPLCRSTLTLAVQERPLQRHQRLSES